MDAGMAGGAKSNQPFQRMLSGAPVMHMNPPRIEVGVAAALAKPPIAEKNRLAMPAETALGIPDVNLANPAEVRAGCLSCTTRAEKAALDGHRRIIPDKAHYR